MMASGQKHVELRAENIDALGTPGNLFQIVIEPLNPFLWII